MDILKQQPRNIIYIFRGDHLKMSAFVHGLGSPIDAHFHYFFPINRGGHKIISINPQSEGSVQRHLWKPKITAFGNHLNQYNRRNSYIRTHAYPCQYMYATLPLWALSKDWADWSLDWQSHHKHLRIDGTWLTTKRIPWLNPEINTGKCERRAESRTRTRVGMFHHKDLSSRA